MITADKFLDCAKKIVSNSSIPEEECRTAIGRAYYSLYHQTLAVVVSRHSLKLIRNIERNFKRHLKQFEKNQLNSLDPAFLMKCNLHKILPFTLTDINEPVLATAFKNFRDKRNQADYELKLTFTYSDANTIVGSIDGLASQIKSL
jgi:uncharacterized protein (UPF0332 family)